MWDMTWQIAIMVIFAMTILNAIGGGVMMVKIKRKDIKDNLEKMEDNLKDENLQLSRHKALLDTAEMYHKLGMAKEFQEIMDSVGKEYEESLKNRLRRLHLE